MRQLQTTAPIEYTIYTFDPPAPRQKGSYSWRKYATLGDLAGALDEAKSLYETRKYQRIEIKKKFFDEQKNRMVDKTLKTFDSEPGLAKFRRIFDRSLKLFSA